MDWGVCVVVCVYWRGSHDVMGMDRREIVGGVQTS